MQKCESCGHTFNYSTMCFAIRHVTCPDCNSKYKVEAKGNLMFTVLVASALLIVAFLSKYIPAGYGWLAFVAAIVFVFIIAPFNQKLEKCS